MVGVWVVITIPLLVDISDTMLGVLLELGIPFDRPDTKTLAALFDRVALTQQLGREVPCN